VISSEILIALLLAIRCETVVMPDPFLNATVAVNTCQRDNDVGKAILAAWAPPKPESVVPKTPQKKKVVKATKTTKKKKIYRKKRRR
jgi:hypothetical protein